MFTLLFVSGCVMQKEKVNVGDIKKLATYINNEKGISFEVQYEDFVLTEREKNLCNKDSEFCGCGPICGEAFILNCISCQYPWKIYLQFKEGNDNPDYDNISVYNTETRNWEEGPYETLNINGLKVFKYEFGELDRRIGYEVVGKEFNYLFYHIASSVEEDNLDNESIESMIRTIKLIDIAEDETCSNRCENTDCNDPDCLGFNCTCDKCQEELKEQCE